MLPVVLGVGLLGVGSVVGPSVIAASQDDSSDYTLTALPADLPDQGLVYEGLKPAASNALCAGSYLLYDETCTHGPDPAPTGLSVRRDMAAVTAASDLPTTVAEEAATVPADAEIARDLGGSALTADAPALVPDAAPGQADFIMGNDGVACDGDGRSGKRVQMLYLHTAGDASRYGEFLNSFRTWAAGVDAIYDASAGETGGSRHVAYVTTPECRVDVVEVQLPAGSLDSFAATVDALRTLGYNRTDRKYLMFADSNVYCGISTYVDDNRPGRTNRNNGGPSYSRVDSGCWSSVMAAHELTHSLGAVLTGAPHASGAGGCLDDYDILCGEDRSGKTVKQSCPKNHEIRLDCGHDDYFNTNPAPGSYLDTHWNVALSDFLLRSDGGDDIPDAPGAVQPDASATAAPDASPSTDTGSVPSDAAAASTEPTVPATTPATSEPAQADPGATAADPSGLPTTTVPAAYEAGANGSGDQDSGAPETGSSSGDGVQAVLEIRDATSMSVRLTWSAAAKDAKYQVWVDGQPVATTLATRARLIGLKPDATYQVRVTSKQFGYDATGTATTSPVARPVQNSYFVLTNSLAGDAADLYAANTANGAPITLGSADGGTQQQWQLVPAENDTYQLVSKASNKCVLPLGGTLQAGTPLVQGDCTTDTAARWTLQASAYGFTLRTVAGDLVVGVGAQRFGTHRVLVLQADTGQRHQSWTAVPS
ncbi:RICIN domain-containing protein [Actinoplanes sp. NPDC051851]|uniref:RICIN domain-containing protein n=1 Tax=Actinoplanes sp. NPDC051851 TaxID=3154753 RepID=UPI003436F6FE